MPPPTPSFFFVPPLDDLNVPLSAYAHPTPGLSIMAVFGRDFLESLVDGPANNQAARVFFLDRPNAK